MARKADTKRMRNTAPAWPREQGESERAAHKAAAAFNDFLHRYMEFRVTSGLHLNRRDGFEMCAAMADKVGRICRNEKHFRREDPRDGWKEETGESIAGLLVYSIMLAEARDVYLAGSMLAELLKAVVQHAPKK